MSDSPDPNASQLAALATPGKIARCFFGSLFATGLGVLMYRMTIAIAATFANKPVTSDNPTVVNISAAVRTLVTGIVALGAGVFAIAALGLFLLGIQLTVLRLRRGSGGEAVRR